MIERTSERALIHNVDTHFVIIGEGQPVLVLHGWGANIDLMLPLADGLAARGFRVYIPDLPGFGKSELPPGTWSIHDYVTHIREFMSYHHLESIHLVGHSFGGRISLVLGAEQPQLINKMVLIDSAGVRPQASLQARFRLHSYKAVQKSLRAAHLTHIADNLRSWYVERYGSSDYKNAGQLRETFVNIINEDLVPYAAQIKAPTLLLWGANDEDTPLWQGQLLEDTIPDAGLVVFENAGHYSYLDNLHDTIKILTHFFKNS
ncbi:MAG: alpha/beta hydrolase [Chloroflexi bacterium]|nr:MAG: alpha/beta hydrolase [Phototrophicales bacterium]RMF81321.1 MAG: alpha/beta hydrolase [Chloroflexota bacterium]